MKRSSMTNLDKYFLGFKVCRTIAVKIDKSWIYFEET